MATNLFDAPAPTAQKSSSNMFDSTPEIGVSSPSALEAAGIEPQAPAPAPAKSSGGIFITIGNALKSVGTDIGGLVKGVVTSPIPTTLPPNNAATVQKAATNLFDTPTPTASKPSLLQAVTSVGKSIKTGVSNLWNDVKTDLVPHQMSDSDITASVSKALGIPTPTPIKPIGTSDALSQQVSSELSAIPFTDNARQFINSQSFIQGPLPKGVGAETEMGIPLKQGNTIIVGDPSQPEASVGHEMFNSIFSQSGINPATFNSAWQAVLKTDPELKTLDAQISNPSNSAAYHGNGEDTNTNPYDLATERFALLGSLWGNDGLSSIPKSLQSFYAPYLGENNTVTADVSKFKGQTIGEGGAGYTPANNFQDFLSHVGLPTTVVKNPITDTIGNAFDDTVKKVDTSISTISDPNASVSKRVGAGITAATSVANLILSPITAAFNVADNNKILKPFSKAVEYPFQLISKGVNLGVGKIINALPIDNSTKQNLQQPVSDALSLIAQIYAGDIAAEKGIPLVKDKVDEIKTNVQQSVVSSMLAQADTPEKVTDILTQLKVPKDQIDTLVDPLTQAKNISEVKSVLSGNPIEPAIKDAQIDTTPELSTTEISPKPEDLASLAEQITSPSLRVAGVEKPIVETPTISSQKYPQAEDIISPKHTDDIDFYKGVQKDVVDNYSKEDARDSAVSKIDEIIRTSGDEGAQMLKMVVDKFGLTDTRKIFREGYMSDTMTPKALNNLFDAKTQAIKNLPEFKPVASVIKMNTLSPEIDKLPLTDTQKNAMQAFFEGDNSTKTKEVLGTIPTKVLDEASVTRENGVYARSGAGSGDNDTTGGRNSSREGVTGGGGPEGADGYSSVPAQQRVLSRINRMVENSNRVDVSEPSASEPTANPAYSTDDVEKINTQAKDLMDGKVVKVDENTGLILHAMGAPRAVTENITTYIDKGAFDTLVLSKTLDGTPIFGGYFENMLYINPEQFDSAVYTSGEILPHELGGHSVWEKATFQSKEEWLNGMIEDPDVVKKAWKRALNTDIQYYWKTTLEDIQRRLKQKVDEKTADRIMNRADLTFDPNDKANSIIDQSLKLPQSFDKISRELQKLDISPLILQPENTDIINEHFALISEQAQYVNSTNEALQEHIENIRDNTEVYRKVPSSLRLEVKSLRVNPGEDPRELLRQAERNASEKKESDIFIEELDKVVSATPDHGDFVRALASNEILKDSLPQLNKMVREKGYANLTDYYIKNKITSNNEKGIVPQRVFATPKETSLPQVKKINVSNKEVPMAEADKAQMEEFRTQEMVIKEMLDDHPGKVLQKFVSKKEGGFEDFKNPDLAKTPSEKKQIEERNSRIVEAAESALQNTQYHDQFDNPDVIRAVIDDYKSIQTDLGEVTQQRKGFEKSEREARNIRKDEKALEKEAKKNSVKEMPESVNDVKPPEARGGITAPRLDFTQWKDKAMFALNRDTFERNIEKVAPRKDAEALKKFLVDPVRQNELNRIKFNNTLRTNTLQKMKEFGITRNSTEDELIQKFGEGLISLTELREAAPKKWGEIQKASDYFRKLYDGLLDQWNAVRKEYGYPEIPKRPDYFRHFDEINFLTKTYGLLSSKNELPTSIAGKTEFFKPGKPFSTAEMRRTGNSTKYSAIGGFNNYIESVSKQIYHIDSIQRGRALEKYIEAAAKVGESLGTPINLPNVIANIREYVNNGLAGKTATLDRALESTLGRPTIAAFQSLSKLIGKNIIVGNLSTALSHLVSLPLIAATTDKVPLMKAMMTTLTNPLSKEPYGTIDGQESSFLLRRFPIEEIMPNLPKKAEEVLSFVFKLTDQFKSRIAVGAKYYEGLNKGLSKEEAMKQADSYAGKVIGDYSLGQKPNLMNAKTTSLLAQFQLGLNDSMSVLVHDLAYESKKEYTDKEGNEKTKTNYRRVAWKLIQFAVYSYLFNQILKQIRGSGKGLDPIDTGLTLMGLNAEGANQPFIKRVGSAVSDVAGELPFTSAFTGNFPLASAISGPLTDILAGKWKEAGEAVAADFLSPIGGGLQAQKTVQGVQAIQQGEAETRAQEAQALIFGPKTTLPNDKASQALQKTLKADQTKLGEYDPDLVKKVQGVFDQVEKVGFGTPEGDALVDGLTDNEYKIYKSIGTVYKAQQAITNESKILPIVQQVHALGFGTPEGDKLVADSFPDTSEGDTDYAEFQSMAKTLYGSNSGSDDNEGTSGTPNPNKVSDSEQTWDQESLIKKITNTAKALGTDPVTTFNDVFAGNSSWRIAGVENGQVIVVRAPQATTEAVKKSQGADTKDYKLDHTIPLEIGGNNGSDNLLVLPTGDANTQGTWAGNTATEDLLGNALADGKITGAQAREYIIRYKAGVGEPISAPLMKEYKNKYGGKPLTADEVQQLVK